jgi:beta-propeller repeat-containing protein
MSAANAVIHRSGRSSRVFRTISPARAQILQFLIVLAGTFVCPKANGEEPYVTEWAQRLRTDEADESFSAAVDHFGNLYVSGLTSGDLGAPNSGRTDAFLTKYSSQGNLLWTRQLGTNQTDSSSSVAVNPYGDIYIAGTTSGSLAGLNGGSTDAYLARYDSAGNMTWSRQIGLGSADDGQSVAVDSLGNSYLSGMTTGSLGGPSAGLTDTFLSKFDNGGNLVWSRQLGSSRTEGSGGVAVDSLGNLYVPGITDGDLGATNAGGFDAFLGKYDPAGNLVWLRQFGTAAHDSFGSVAFDELDNAYISGSSGGTRVLIKYDSAGNLLWSRDFGTHALDNGMLAVDDSGNSYVGGRTEDSMGEPIVGGSDSFLIKYDTHGNLLWLRQFGTIEDEFTTAIAVDDLANAYLTGFVRPRGQTDSSLEDVFVVKFSPVSEPSAFILAAVTIAGLLMQRRRYAIKTT